MADYEALAPGGHAHLVSDIKSYADRAGGKGTTQLADGAVTRAKLASDVIARLEHMHDMGDTLKGNNFFGTLAEGIVLTADDVYGAPASDVDVYGVSTQIQTTGKNLFDASAYTESGKRLDANGNVVSTGGWYVSEYMDVGGASSIARSGFDANAGVRDAFYDGNKSLLLVVDHSPTVVSAPEGAAFMRCSYLSGDRTRDTMQYERGTSSTSYEPYTDVIATPCPDYPQPIHSVDMLILQTRGKNLFPTSTTYNGASISRVGANVTVNGDVFTFVASASDIYIGTMGMDGASWVPGYGALMPVAYGDEYYLEVSNTDFKKNYITWYDENRIARYRTTITSNTATVSVPNSSYKWASLRIGNGSATAGTTYTTTIFFGSTTSYEPYVGASISLLPEDADLRSLPDNTRDQLTLSYVKKSTTPGYGVFSKVLTQRIDECDLGDFEWEYSTTYHMMHAEVDGMRTAESGTYTLYCTGYKDYNNASVSSLDTNMPDKSIAQRANYAILYVKDNGYTDAELFTTAVTGMKVQYALATPVTHDLGTVELPVLPAPDLTAWCDGGSAQPSMSIGYEQDVNIVIQGLEAAIAELATA